MLVGAPRTWKVTRKVTLFFMVGGILFTHQGPTRVELWWPRKVSPVGNTRNMCLYPGFSAKWL